MKKKTVLHIGAVVIALVVLNLVGGFVYARFDLTEDKRYTLTETTEQLVSGFESTVIIDVLLEGKLPAEFERLKVETSQLLEEFATVNRTVKFSFEDPLEDSEQAEATIAQLQSIGLTPANVMIEEEGKRSQELVFPWAMVTYQNKTVKVALLKNKLGANTEDRINNSVQNLEYAFADAFTKLQVQEKKRIAVLKGNGELEDIYMADFLTGLREYYNIGAITLDSVDTNPQKVFDQLKTFDLAVIARPTTAFSETEKYILDQFMVNGGKSLWMVDPVTMDLDSLNNERGSGIALPRELNLDDLLFRYGVRLKPVLVKDLYCTQIVLASGEGSSSEYNPVPWPYNPMVFSKNNHPVNRNIEAVKYQFTSALDTLPNAYTKTILAQSSPVSRLESVPTEIGFDLLNIPPDKVQYTNGEQPLSVLIEGAFASAYTNRIHPVELEGSKEEGPDNKMIVIADGDIIKNQLKQGRPLELGYDQWTNNFYGNKEFLLNCVNYLLDDSGLINIRNKEVRIPLLDAEKISDQRMKWQLINVGVPLLFILLFGFLFQMFRKGRYSK